nr:Uncharacterised protein [Raoultella sp. NCTC 9187]
MVNLPVGGQPLGGAPHATKMRNVVSGVALRVMSYQPGFKSLLPVNQFHALSSERR